MKIIRFPTGQHAAYLSPPLPSPPPATSKSLSHSSYRGMNLFKILSSKISSKSAESVSTARTQRTMTTTTTTTTTTTATTRTTPSPPPRQVAAKAPSQAPRSSGPRTRRPAPRSSGMEDEAPPAYSPTPINQATATQLQDVPSEDSPYSFLAQFDTVFLVDDSGSMAGKSWRQTCAALRAIAPICTAYDRDGIDIYFLNHRNPFGSSSSSSSSNRGVSFLGGYANVMTAAAVDEIFRNVRPYGGTPTGTRLNQILKPYLAELKKSLNGSEPEVKPLNIIVITDGVPSDDVESVIVGAAKKLDSYHAEPWQVGIQFFQVGNEPEAAADLRDLDDVLSSQHGIRDMVDTVPWSGGNDEQTLTAEQCLKVTMGAVNRRLDRRQLSTTDGTAQPVT